MNLDLQDIKEKFYPDEDSKMWRILGKPSFQMSIRKIAPRRLRYFKGLCKTLDETYGLLVRVDKFYRKLSKRKDPNDDILDRLMQMDDSLCRIFTRLYEVGKKEVIIYAESPINKGKRTSGSEDVLEKEEERTGIRKYFYEAADHQKNSFSAKTNELRDNFNDYVADEERLELFRGELNRLIKRDRIIHDNKERWLGTWEEKNRRIRSFTICPLKQREETKILFLASNPMDTGELQLEREFREIQQILLQKTGKEEDLKARFHLDSRNSAGRMDFVSTLVRKPNIIHFAGHGSAGGKETGRRSAPGIQDPLAEERRGIILEGIGGKSDATGPELAKLIREVADEIDCVVLNACYSEEQAKAILDDVPYVIGMSSAIYDETAINFATVFYTALKEGRDIEGAFDYAIVSIEFLDLPGYDIPQLLKNGELVRERRISWGK